MTKKKPPQKSKVKRKPYRAPEIRDEESFERFATLTCGFDEEGGCIIPFGSGT